MLSVNNKQSGESVESVLKKKRKAAVGKKLQIRKVSSLEWKGDDESGESMEPMEEVPLKELGVEWVCQNWRD